MAGPSDKELQELVGQLQLDEKIAMLAGQNVWETVPVDRLGIPSLKVSDGPNGARGGDFFDGTTAACFPACVSLAATFNRDLVQRVGKALGEECQTKGAYALLGPTVCGHRSPLGGRNFEAFSEDPFLSGSLAIEYVKGLQSERVAATVKHFLANEQDTRRFSVNEIISERALREIYLRPFELVVKEADPWCFMSSYPKVNGAHVDAQPTFLQDILRQEWGYKGLVMSDWGAATNAVGSIKYGMDLEMPGPPRARSAEAVNKSLQEGLITEADIDKRILALLHLLKKTGKFTDRRDTPPEQAINRPEHQTLIREAGGEGIVLLKNKDNTLPLKASSMRKVALLGPLARYAAAHGGGSASLNCHYKISPYDAFVNRLGSSVEITHSKGAHIFRVYPDLEAGVTNSKGNAGFACEFFANMELQGEPMHVEEYPRGGFTTLMNTRATGAHSARFTGTYKPPKSGKHYLSFSGMGPSKFFINDELVSEQKAETKDSMAFLLGVQEEARFQYVFDANKEYRIRIESIPSQVPNSELYLMDGLISIHLGLVEEAEMEVDLLAEAVRLAKEADYAILFVGNTTQWETEGQDLSSMTLPADGSQDRLISAVAAVNPNTIVVNTTGVPVELPWLDDVAAFVQAWYAGQETGNAILDVLLGEMNPSGKLPSSWPKKYEHTACYGHFGLDSYDSREVEYVEGVFVGYRHFDRHYHSEKEVLFPFGFGLSYSDFEVSDANVVGALDESQSPVTVTATVKNVGTAAGAETVQVYIAPPQTSELERPVKGLAGYEKVFLNPGEEKTVEVQFTNNSPAAYWDEKEHRWRVTAGEYAVWVATSSSPADVKAKLPLVVKRDFTFNP